MSCDSTDHGACAQPCTTSSSSIPDLEDKLAAALQRAKIAEEALAKAKAYSAASDPARPLRSQSWFAGRERPDQTALYLGWYLNYGLTLPELNDGRKPIIGIAQTGSDIAPCNRHHLELAKRVRAGILSAGGTPMEFPCHPIQETGKRPTAALDRNLMYLSLVETLFGFPLDGVVLLGGCDKTTPALLMAAATVNIPSILLNVGPMLNGYSQNRLIGSGTAIWESRKRYATGEIDFDEFIDVASGSAPSVGHCSTLGTASTMNALAEALGMSLPGSSTIPAAYRERGQMAYKSGQRIVELVMQDIKPTDIMTRGAFENAIALNTAIGGSTNAPIHINAIAKHINCQPPITCDDWEKVGHALPLLVNVQPAGEWLCEDYYRAGGLPAVTAELLQENKLPDPNAMTVSGKTIGENCRGKFSWNRKVIKTFKEPLLENAGFLHLSGTLFDSAIMKTSVISADFRARFLSNPDDPDAFEGPVAVFDGPEDYHHRIDESPTTITDKTILIMRGAGPLGYPGAAEVANMQVPAELLKKGIQELPCLSDGRQSGTSGSPSILNASPEAASNGPLTYIQDGDIVRIDLIKRRIDLKVSPEEIEKRRKEKGPWKLAPSQTPWQEIYRNDVSTLSEGMVMKSAIKYQRVAQEYGVPRHNH